MCVPGHKDAWLAELFDEHRSQLRAVAFRMLGSASEADDAVQEAWLRLHRTDHAAVQLGAVPEVRGAIGIAGRFSGRALAARPALIDGVIGAAWASGGTLRGILSFTIANGKITAIDVVADQQRINQIGVQMLTQ